MKLSSTMEFTTKRLAKRSSNKTRRFAQRSNRGRFGLLLSAFLVLCAVLLSTRDSED